MGNIAFFRSDYDKAESYYLDALERYTKAVGAIHPAIADLETNLGNVAWARKDYEKARKHYHDTLELLETLYGADDTASLDTLSNLAAVEEDTHNYEAAEKLYRRALDIVAKTRGKDHVDGAVSHSGLGNILHRQERYEEALELYREGHQIMLSEKGERDRESLILGSGVAEMLRRVGRLDESEELHRRQLETARAAGADHLVDASEDLRLRVKELGGADVVYDPVGGDQFKSAFRACNPEARLIAIGFASGDVPQIPANHLMVKNLDVIGFYIGGYMKFRPDVVRESMATLMRWFDEGRLQPHISHSLPLDEVEQGWELLRERRSTGKVVIRLG